MAEGRGRISEERAQRLWKRAAELQAAADSGAHLPPAPADVSNRSGGYDLTQVRDAAAEAGIAPEYVALAFAEAEEDEPETGDGVDRWARRLSGQDTRTLVASRRFDHPVDDVASAALEVLSRHGLSLIDARGELGAGGTLVFAVPRTGVGDAAFVASDLGFLAKVEEVHFRLMAADDDACVATLSAPLAPSRRAHVGGAVAMLAGGGVIGGWAIGAVGAAAILSFGLGAAITTALIGGALAVGAGTGIGTGVALSRASLRSHQRRGTAALERLLQTVGIELRMGSAGDRSISTLPPGPPPAR